MWKIAGLLLGWVLCTPFLAYANHAVGHNGVLEINEWGTRTQLNWTYSTNPPYSPPDNNKPILDPNPAGGCGPSPSGGGAIRGQHQPGTYTSSTAGGTSAWVVPAANQLTTVFYGHWICFSNPFDFNPVGTKIHFLTQRDVSGGNVNPSGRDNYVVNSKPGGHGLWVTTQMNWDNCTYPKPNFSVEICTKNWDENRGHIDFVKGRWYWLESQAIMNTTGNGFASSHNGTLRVWLDDALMIEYFDVPFRTTPNNVWFHLANTPILGGGGQVINQEQYMFYDHNVISTQRIGRPGGAPIPGDSTPPTPPTGLTVQ